MTKDLVKPKKLVGKPKSVGDKWSYDKSPTLEEWRAMSEYEKEKSGHMGRDKKIRWHDNIKTAIGPDMFGSKESYPNVEEYWLGRATKFYEAAGKYGVVQKQKLYYASNGTHAEVRIYLEPKAGTTIDVEHLIKLASGANTARGTNLTKKQKAEIREKGADYVWYGNRFLIEPYKDTVLITIKASCEDYTQMAELSRKDKGR